MKRNLLTLLIALVISVASPLVCAQLTADQANTLAQKAEAGDVPALSTLRLNASQGDALAQYYLASMYLSGRGVPQNNIEAVKWFRKAADQGHAVAQTMLGFFYGDGRIAPKNNTEAAKWFHKAADQGIAKAQSILGMLYAEGLGVPQDYAEAVKWYLKAAEQGDASAQHNLGGMYYLGRGTPKDVVQAYKWALLSQSISKPGSEVYKNASVSKNIIVKEMTHAQITRAEQEASAWLSRHSGGTDGK